MARADLIALSADDLASLTNRGTVKRATRELNEGSLTCEITDQVELVVQWSDSVRCVFPAGQTIHDATCSSGVIGISRHVVRSVLAYQRWCAGQETADPAPEANESDVDGAGSSEADDVQRTSWNPGDIVDEDLVSHFRKAAIQRARKQFESGVLVELTRGRKPTARFLHQSCTIRFPVPGDVRYARGDCSDATLPHWVAMAVWSFRHLPADREAGLVSLGQSNLTIPTDAIASLAKLIHEWIEEGFAGLSTTWPSRFARSEAKVRKAGLIWPAELMSEIAQQRELYDQSNARFSGEESARLVGELIARLRAIANPRSELPQVLVRGNPFDSRAEIKAGRFVGLGFEVRPSGGQNTLLAYFQDSDAGNVVAVKRVLGDSETDDELPAFESLAKHSLSRGVSIGSASMSQMMLGSGKRTPADELILPRGASRITIHPQSFQWEHLLPPTALDRFNQCRERLDRLPPSYLCPRRATESLQVFPIRRLFDVDFDVVNQNLIAALEDHAGDLAEMEVPFFSRSTRAFNEFDRQLRDHGPTACFISGHVELSRGRLTIRPLAIIFQPSEAERVAASPWLGVLGGKADSAGVDAEERLMDESPIHQFLSDQQTRIAQTLITGLRDEDPQIYRDLAERAERLGFTRLPMRLKILSDELERRYQQRDWNCKNASQQFSDLMLLACVIG